MPTLYRGNGWRITVYFGDHHPPHFHIMTKNGDAQVKIDDLTVMRGDVPGRILRAARAWASKNKEALKAAWDKSNA